jgi:hypothetical protein
MTEWQTEEAHEEVLRRVLAVEAEKVDVAPDALAVIRRKIVRRADRWWPEWLPRSLVLVGFTGGTALVAAALAAVVLLGVPRAYPPTAGPAAPLPGGPPSANLPVYYTGATSSGPRLYREYHPMLVADNGPGAKAAAAVSAMLLPHSAFDPDYTSPWPDGVTVRSAVADGDTVIVDLAGLPAGSGGAATATVRMSLEQLIWTATAASGTTKVRLLSDGQPVTTFRGISGLGPVQSRGPAVDVLAPVWLIDPQQGAPVGHTIKVKLAGSVPEGVVRLRVRTAAGALVRDQPVQLSAGAPQRGEAQLTVTLPTGAYTFEAYVVSTRDGTEQYLDGHQVTVP